MIKTFSKNGATVTFHQKSLRRSMFFRQLLKVLADDPSLDDYDERNQFAWVAAHVKTTSGIVIAGEDGKKDIAWEPPQQGGASEDWEKSYQVFLDAIPGYEFFNGMSAALDEPLADLTQRPDEALTDEEKADPN